MSVITTARHIHVGFVTRQTPPQMSILCLPSRIRKGVIWEFLPGSSVAGSNEECYGFSNAKLLQVSFYESSFGLNCLVI